MCPRRVSLYPRLNELIAAIAVGFIFAGPLHADEKLQFITKNVSIGSVDEKCLIEELHRFETIVDRDLLDPLRVEVFAEYPLVKRITDAPHAKFIYKNISYLIPLRDKKPTIVSVTSLARGESYAAYVEKGERHFSLEHCIKE